MQYFLASLLFLHAAGILTSIFFFSATSLGMTLYFFDSLSGSILCFSQYKNAFVTGLRSALLLESRDTVVVILSNMLSGVSGCAMSSSALAAFLRMASS